MKKNYILKKELNGRLDDPTFKRERDKRLAVEAKLGYRMSDSEWCEYKRRFVR